MMGGTGRILFRHITGLPMLGKCWTSGCLYVIDDLGSLLRMPQHRNPPSPPTASCFFSLPALGTPPSLKEPSVPPFLLPNIAPDPCQRVSNRLSAFDFGVPLTGSPVLVFSSSF